MAGCVDDANAPVKFRWRGTIGCDRPRNKIAYRVDAMSHDSADEQDLCCILKDLFHPAHSDVK